MEYLCYFALGMLAVLAGVALGIFMEKKGGRYATRIPLTEQKEREELAEEQRAFNRLITYNCDTAYGMVMDEEAM